MFKFVEPHGSYKRKQTTDLLKYKSTRTLQRNVIIIEAHNANVRLR